jgi:hypothetical protein
MSTFDTTNPHVPHDSIPLIVNINPPKKNRLKNLILIFTIFTMIFLIVLLISYILIIIFKQKISTSRTTTTTTLKVSFSTSKIGK